ncbi:MAG: hypothetical protein K2M48_01575, partial [Clostridiales bacterium]|nr:hypothetical protein [Clostridiales bacterium]
MKRTVFIIAAFALFIFLFAFGIGGSASVVKAQSDDGLVCVAKNAEDETVPDSVDDLLDKLNFDSIQSLIDSLDKDSLEIFGFTSIVERIRAVANGEVENDFGSIVSYVMALLGIDVFKFLPMLLSVLAIVLAYNVINSVKGRFASESTEKVIYFATGAIAICVVVGFFTSVL